MDLLTAKPKLTGNVQEDIKSLTNHIFQLEEQLRYQLRNLDVTNFNDLGLARYENGRLQVYSEVVEIQTEKLSAEVKNITDGLSSKIEQTDEEISAIVQSVGADGKVTAASIVAAINAQGESAVKIKADKVDITGIVTVSSLATPGKTVINADNILTGTVKGVSFIAKGDFDVSGGTSNSFVVQNGMGYSVGKIGYTFVGGEGVHSDKLYLKTEEFYYNEQGLYVQPAVKIFGIGGVSLEAGISAYTGEAGPVYIASQGSYVTLRGNTVNIYDSAGAVWEFKNGGLFKNGTQVL